MCRKSRYLGFRPEASPQSSDVDGDWRRLRRFLWGSLFWRSPASRGGMAPTSCRPPEPTYFCSEAIRVKVRALWARFWPRCQPTLAPDLWPVLCAIDFSKDVSQKACVTIGRHWSMVAPERNPRQFWGCRASSFGATLTEVRSTLLLKSASGFDQFRGELVEFGQVCLGVWVDLCCPKMTMSGTASNDVGLSVCQLCLGMRDVWAASTKVCPNSANSQRCRPTQHNAHYFGPRGATERRFPWAVA